MMHLKPQKGAEAVSLKLMLLVLIRNASQHIVSWRNKKKIHYGNMPIQIY